VLSIAKVCDNSEEVQNTRLGDKGNAIESKSEELSSDMDRLILALTPKGFQSFGEGASHGRIVGATALAVDNAMNHLIARLIPELQQHLNSLVGNNFGPIINADLAKAITRLLRRLGPWALECPHCKGPAVLRFSHSSERTNGIFRYEHSPSKRHGASTVLGPLRIIPIQSDVTNA